jgi:hypothetical protein
VTRPLWVPAPRRRSQLAAAELAEAARAAERAAISELAAVFLFQTAPTDRALAGWGAFGGRDEVNRAPAIINAAAQVSAAAIIEDALAAAAGGIRQITRERPQ